MELLGFGSLIILGLLPGFLWLIFFLKEDFHPEPKLLIFLIFFLGILISGPIFLAQLGFQKILTSFKEDLFFVFIFGFALIEEFFKFLVTYLTINDHPAFDEPIDAMIYMMAAALGLATIENILIIFQTKNLIQATDVITLRFSGATLLHALSSGLVGYYWALGKIKNKSIVFILFGLILATLIHALFNYSIQKLGGENFVYASIILIITAFLVFGDFEKLRQKQN